MNNIVNPLKSATRLCSTATMVLFLFAAILIPFSVTTGFAQTGISYRTRIGPAEIEKRLTEIKKTHPWIRLSSSFLKEIERREKLHRGIRIDVRGRVLSPDGKPVEGALVLLTQRTNSKWSGRVQRDARGTFAYGWTDADGRYDLKSVATHWVGWNDSGRWAILVLSPGFAVGSVQHENTDADVFDEDLTLKHYHNVTGRFVDSSDQPIPVKMRLLQVIDGRVSKMPFKDPDFYDLNLLSSELPELIETNADGQFTIPGLPPDRIAVLQLYPPTKDSIKFSSLSHSVLRILTTPDFDRDRMVRSSGRRGGEVNPFVENGAVIRATKTIDQLGGLRLENVSVGPLVFGASDKRWGMQVPRSEYYRRIYSIDDLDPRPFRVAKVRVVDAKTNAPLPNVYVDWCIPEQPIQTTDDLQGRLPCTLTDENGIAEIVIPKSAVSLFTYGRYPGYKTPYGRHSTATREPFSLPPVDQWVRRIPASKDDLSVTFQLEPLPPVRIRILNQDGKPVAAEVNVSDADQWSDATWTVQTDSKGIAKVSILPTISTLRIEVTQDGQQKRLRTVDLDPENPVIEMKVESP